MNNKTSNFKQSVKRNMYKWHRTIGLITVIPVIFWTLSGLMHPFLSNWFKPQIAHQILVPKPINKGQIELTLQDVLLKNNIQEFKNFRIVNFDQQTYYQLKSIKGDLHYFNTTTGIALSNGDERYAEYLARYFIADRSSKIKSITVQTGFSQQYKYVNRYLPVWKVSFNRKDAMDVYVETASSQLATFNTDARKTFLWLFDNFHSWSFLEAISNNTVKTCVMVALLSIITLSALSGILIYGVLWKKFKKPKRGSKIGFLRLYHRQIGICISLLTLTFAFSGAYHVMNKLNPNTIQNVVYQPNINLSELKIPNNILNLDLDRLNNISLVKFKKQVYFQVFYNKTEDLPEETIYINAKDSSKLNNGNLEYAKFLANKFENKSEDTDEPEMECCTSNATENDICKAKLIKTSVLYKFDDREYGFVFKRLPVVKLTYNTPNHTNLYIDTKTSRLAAKIADADRYEGYSFAFLHKFHYLDWAGKNFRDFFILLAALLILTVSLLGLMIFIKK